MNRFNIRVITRLLAGGGRVLEPAANGAERIGKTRIRTATLDHGRYTVLLLRLDNLETAKRSGQWLELSGATLRAMPDFAAIYRDFFHTVGYPLQPEHALPLEPSVVAPLALRQFYEVAGRAEEWTQSHHRFLFPDDWEAGEYCVFLEENQGVLLWGFRRQDAHLDNPPISQAMPEPDVAPEWEPFGLSCSEFLLFMVAFQPFNGEAAFPVLDKATFRKKVGQRLAASPAWRLVVAWENARVYVRLGCLLCHDDWGEGPTLFCGTHSKEELEHIGAELGVKWDGGLY